MNTEQRVSRDPVEASGPRCEAQNDGDEPSVGQRELELELRRFDLDVRLGRQEYLLQLFSHAADQRMKSFNFYAIVAAAAITGSIVAFEKCPWQLVVAMGFVHVAMGLVFCIVDIRSCRLVSTVRRALRELESDPCFVATDRVMQVDDGKVRGKRDSSQGLDRHPIRRLISQCCGHEGASYTRAFNIAFTIQILAGIGLALAAVWIKGPMAAAGH